MVVDKSIADSFIKKYKKLLKYINGDIEPGSIEDYVSLRSEMFKQLETEEKKLVRLVGKEFFGCLKLAKFSEYIYLKKYKNGYVFFNITDNLYYQALALTSPLEEMVYEYSYIETAIMPFQNYLICDGLFLSKGVSCGKNMSKELRDGYWDAKRSGQLVTKA